MPGEQTEDLNFYHGTGKAAARAIFEARSGVPPLEEIGAFDVGREIRQALLRHAGLSQHEDWKLHFAFKVPGQDYSSLWAPALRQLAENADRSHFAYGHFFATLNIANAFRYAIGNPYRSEFVRVLAKSLEVLTHLGDPLPSNLATRYPEVAHLIESPSPPVVLELRGIARERLRDERGGNNIDAELQDFYTMQEFAGVNAPAAVRIRDVSPDDIVAIYDVSGWAEEEVHDAAWRPDPARVAAVRHLANAWFVKAVAD